MTIQLEDTTMESRRVANLIESYFGSAAKQKDFEGVYLAGGAISSIFSGLNVNDLDFYCESLEVADRLVASLTSSTYGYKEVHSTENAVTLTKKNKKRTLVVQVIRRFVGTPDEVLSTFDFTCVMGLYDFRVAKFFAHKSFLRDVAARRLVFAPKNKSRYPICALYRTKKYVERGYSLSGATIVSLAMAIHALKIETYADLKDQLMGIDTSMFNEITASIDSDKKFEVDEFVQNWMTAFEGDGKDGIFGKLDSKTDSEED